MNKFFNALLIGLIMVAFVGFSSCGKNDDITEMEEEEEETQVISCDSLDLNITFDGDAGTLTVLAAGGNEPYTYSWLGEETTATIEVDEEVSYYLATVTDAEGCVNEVEYELDVNDPCASFSLDFEWYADDFALEAVVEGGTPPYTYSWSTEETTTWATAEAGGDYGVTVTDSEGCTVTGQYTIDNIDDPCVELGVDFEYFAEDFALEATVEGGVPPYIYEWSTGETTTWANVTGPGIFSVFVVDANGCTGSGEYTVEDVDVPCGDLFPFIQFDENLSILGAGADSQGPFTYEWSTGETGEFITVFESGTYTVTITNADGCSEEATYTVDLIGCDLDASFEWDAVSGTLTANATGGTPPYAYTWSNGATGESIQVTDSGLYTVFVTDAQGCETINETGVTVVDPNPDCDGQLNVTAAGDSPINIDESGVAFVFGSDCSNGAGDNLNFMILTSAFAEMIGQPNVFFPLDGVQGVTFGANSTPVVGETYGVYISQAMIADWSAGWAYETDNMQITITESGSQEGEYIGGIISGTIVAQNDPNDTTTISGSFCVPIVSACE